MIIKRQGPISFSVLAGLICMLIVGLCLAGAIPAAAGTSGALCIKEKTGLNNPSCTANDVRISSLALNPGQGGSYCHDRIRSREV
jgi:hypothetical protein